MRKKSHISLAGQIMNSMELDNVFDYRLPFYVGSIWPDCRPSFVTTPHKFDITFDDIERKISKFIANYDKDKGMNMRRCAGLGVIIHYIADYFTFPHNDHYPGNVKDHCYYERDLKFGMRAFLQTEEAAQIKEHVAAYDSVEELTSYIRSIHNCTYSRRRYQIYRTCVYNRCEECTEYGKLCSWYKCDEYSVCIGQGIEDKIIKKKGKDRQR